MIALSQALVSLGRLDRYMSSRELRDDSVERSEGCDGVTAVDVQDGTFTWDDDGLEQDLKNINLKVNKGELTAIVGTVGSGKSSLLASILGEMHKTSGKVSLFF
jgi:ABC-type transport system involved in cytochrome bd biosynthesis fused ATPase/permease subunit